MRVLHVLATGQRRGAETFAADLSRALADRSIEQSVALLRGPDLVRFDQPALEIGSGWGGVKALRRAQRFWEPDIVFAHGGDALKHAVPATLGTPARLVYRRIGSSHYLVSRRSRRLAYAALMRRADRVVAVSDHVRRETLRMFRVPPERCVTIPNAVDPVRLVPRRGREETRRFLGISLDAPVVASIGAFTWEKDPLWQIEVVRVLFEERPDTHVLMVGDGPLLGRTHEAVAASRMRDQIHLLGSREDIGDLLAASDVLLLASKTEGLPGSLVEAGMVGLPVVAHDIGGVSDVVLDGQTGFLASPGDGDALARSLSKLLVDPDLRRAVGEAARRRCRALFEIGPIARGYVQLFEELMVA